MGGEEVLLFRFRVVALWTVPASRLLASGSPGLLPLVPFAGESSPERVEEAVRALEAVEHRERRIELLSALAVFSRRAVRRRPGEVVARPAANRGQTPKMTA